MKHAAGSSGLPHRFEAPGGRVQVVRARGASDRAQVQERFLRELGAAELWLRGEGIPHVLIGSLACWAHAGHGIAPVFGRLEAFSAVQRCPDIDVLVPRAALDAVREYAQAARSGPFPVAIDASGAACFIDLRPRSELSYLTHRRLRFPVPSDLLAPQPAWLEGVEITTIDPRVLHTFGAIGGITRRKDVAKITALVGALESGAAVSRFSEDDCAVFTRYAEERDSRYPHYRAFVRLMDEMLETLPPAVASGVRYWLMPAAKRTMARLNG